MSDSGSGPNFQDEHEPEENNERWLLTYADLITLLVAFFIMMYSMSIINLQKFQDLALSLRSGFGGDSTGKKGESIIGEKKSLGVMPVRVDNKAGKGEKSAQDSVFGEVKKQLEELVAMKKLQGIVDIKEREGNLYIVIVTDKIFFEPGDAVLTEHAKEILFEIGKVIKNAGREISVEGYTSNVRPVDKYADNWELSAARAINVIKFFNTSNGINQQIMSLTGYGEWRPYFAVKGAEGNNDRVAIALMKKTFKAKDTFEIAPKSEEISAPEPDQLPKINESQPVKY